MAEVSIIIPTKNNGNILEKCLRSIQNLDYPKDKYEVIIVDGHSTDDTVEIAKKYRCKVVYENVGAIGGARNIGVKLMLNKETSWNNPFGEGTAGERIIEILVEVQSSKFKVQSQNDNFEQSQQPW